MFLQKIENYLKLTFLLLLLFTQALIFVAVGARDKQEYLSLIFVEPMAAYLPANNESLFLEAYIEGPQGQRDFSLVYFSVLNQELGYEMNFEAQLTNTDTWRALASWNVSEMFGGQYLVLVKAHFYQDGQWQIYQSQPQIFVIGVNYQAALELDFDDDITISEEQEDQESREQEDQESSQPISDPEEEEVVLSGSINAPLFGQNSSGDLLLQISLNRQLEIDKRENIIVAKINNQENALSFRFNLTTDMGGLVYSRSIDTSLLEDGVLVYPNGAYTVEFVVLDDAGQELLSLGSVNFSIKNEIAEELEEDLSVLMLLSPLPGEPIMEKNFTLNLDTPLYSSGVKAQFYNSVDPAISTGEITIPYFDGYSWTRVIYLDDSFVNGDYILKISLLDENGLVTYTESFGFSLTLGSNEFLFDPSILELKLINLETNISGTVFPVVLSSFDFSSADIYLEIVSSVNEEEKINLPVARTIWETLAAWGFSQSDFVSTPHAYLATLDTSRLANGNYRLLIKNNLNPDLSTGEKLISIFNTAVDQDQAEDLEEVGDLEEELIEDFSDSQPADPEFLIGDLRLEKKFLIYQNKSCLELGIEDKNACQRFMATIQFFDQRCLSQSIFDAPSCEDYLRRLKVDGECQEAGIDDPESCKDYLLEKYAFSVDCRLLDNLFCADILRNQQLNRLVLAKKNQMEMETILGSLIGQTVSTQELGQKIESVGLSKNLLSLAPQAETKVLLVRAESQVILYSEEILAVSGGSLMMIDSDGDGLPDDLERYYGTDPYNPDTDGDGYFDGLEVMNNYNPLGDGPLLQERLFFAELLFAQVPLEQPKFNSARINEDLDLASLENLQNRLRLAGKAEPDTWLLLYLYSDLPMVMLTKTDASGNWYYDIERPLNDGYHKFYVTVNDDSGKIVSQSRPVSFFIKEAQAVAVDEYFDVSLAPEKTQNFLLYYIIGGVFLILLVLGIIIILRKHKKTESGF